MSSNTLEKGDHAPSPSLERPNSCELLLSPCYCLDGSRRITDAAPFKELSILDRMLTPLVFVAMVVGILLGEYVPSIRTALDTAKLDSVSLRTFCATYEKQQMLRVLYSHRNWSHRHDVACPHQSEL